MAIVTLEAPMGWSVGLPRYCRSIDTTSLPIGQADELHSLITAARTAALQPSAARARPLPQGLPPSPSSKITIDSGSDTVQFRWNASDPVPAYDALEAWVRGYDGPAAPRSP